MHRILLYPEKNIVQILEHTEVKTFIIEGCYLYETSGCNGHPLPNHFNCSM